MQEESIEFNAPKSVFYNPQMTFCRSFASLAVGSIEQDLIVCDAFTASGIRGIRYAKENKNVKETIFLDIDSKAISAAKANAKKNKLKKAKFIRENISRAVFDISADFLEIDPFGSPAPYIYDSFRAFNPLKHAYLSATATDVAVLCGGKTKACMKNYHSVPLNNEFTHETGMRIMIKKIAETAAEFNMGIEPLVSISRQHFLKSIIKVTRGADLADESLNKLGYINFCSKCGWRSSSQFPVSSCPSSNTRDPQQGLARKINAHTLPEPNLVAKHKTQFAGPLWLGELHDKKTLERMLKLNKQRNYSQKDEIEKTLSRMMGEINLPPYYFDIHQMCKRLECKSVRKMDDIIARIMKKGYRVTRTHFSETSIKTDAPLKIIESVIR